MRYLESSKFWVSPGERIVWGKRTKHQKTKKCDTRQPVKFNQPQEPRKSTLTYVKRLSFKSGEGGTSQDITKVEVRGKGINLVWRVWEPEVLSLASGSFISHTTLGK